MEFQSLQVFNDFLYLLPGFFNWPRVFNHQIRLFALAFQRHLTWYPFLCLLLCNFVPCHQSSDLHIFLTIDYYYFVHEVHQFTRFIQERNGKHNEWMTWREWIVLIIEFNFDIGYGQTFQSNFDGVKDHCLHYLRVCDLIQYLPLFAAVEYDFRQLFPVEGAVLVEYFIPELLLQLSPGLLAGFNNWKIRKGVKCQSLSWFRNGSAERERGQCRNRMTFLYFNKM